MTIDQGRRSVFKPGGVLSRVLGGPSPCLGGPGWAKRGPGFPLWTTIVKFDSFFASRQPQEAHGKSGPKSPNLTFIATRKTDRKQCSKIAKLTKCSHVWQFWYKLETWDVRRITNFKTPPKINIERWLSAASRSMIQNVELVFGLLLNV